MKQMKTIGIFSPQPTAPFHGMSIEYLRHKVASMETPSWHEYYAASLPHMCTLDDTVIQEVMNVVGDVSGLTLNDFVDRGEFEAE